MIDIVRVLLEVCQGFLLHAHPRGRPLDEGRHALVVALPASSWTESIVRRVYHVTADGPVIGVVQHAVAHSRRFSVRCWRRWYIPLRPGGGGSSLLFRITHMPPWAIWIAAASGAKPFRDVIPFLPAHIVAGLVNCVTRTSWPGATRGHVRPSTPIASAFCRARTSFARLTSSFALLLRRRSSMLHQDCVYCMTRSASLTALEQVSRVVSTRQRLGQGNIGPRWVVRVGFSGDPRRGCRTHGRDERIVVPLIRLGSGSAVGSGQIQTSVSSS